MLLEGRRRLAGLLETGLRFRALERFLALVHAVEYRLVPVEDVLLCLSFAVLPVLEEHELLNGVFEQMDLGLGVLGEDVGEVQNQSAPSRVVRRGAENFGRRVEGVGVSALRVHHPHAKDVLEAVVSDQLAPQVVLDLPWTLRGEDVADLDDILDSRDGQSNRIELWLPTRSENRGRSLVVDLDQIHLGHHHLL